MACVLVAIALTVALLSGSAFATSADSRRKIVMLDNPLTQQVFDQLAAAKITVLYNLSLINALAVQLPDFPLLDPALALLNVLGEVYDDLLTSVDPICPTTAPPSLQEYRWGMQQIKAPEAHMPWPPPSRQTGAVTVAVLDTGIDHLHPELSGRIVQGYDAIFKTGGYTGDPRGHGTHMAGIILAKRNNVGVVGVAGVEPEVVVAPVKVLDPSGNVYVSAVIDGLQWVREHGIRLVNMSFGFAFSNPSQGTPLMQATHKLSTEEGIIMVASAGNRCTAGGALEDGGGDSCGPAASCNAPLTSTTAPAAYEWVIAVEATDVNGQIPAYSLSGEVRAPGGVYFPGAPDNGRILSTDKGVGYAVGHGTSQAAAHVTGAIALALSLESDLSLQEVRALLGQNLNVQDMIDAIP
jgi:subtilisin family serine protease